MQYYVAAPSVLLWDYLLASNRLFVLILLFKPHLISKTRQQWTEITNTFSFTKPGKENHSRNTVSYGSFALLPTCMVSKEAALCLLV
jgi:hypothetical protein